MSDFFFLFLSFSFFFSCFSSLLPISFVSSSSDCVSVLFCPVLPVSETPQPARSIMPVRMIMIVGNAFFFIFSLLPNILSVINKVFRFTHPSTYHQDVSSSRIPQKYPGIIPGTFALLASTRGFEPPAFRLGGERSILLSYVDMILYTDRQILYQKNLYRSKSDLSLKPDISAKSPADLRLTEKIFFIYTKRYR